MRDMTGVDLAGELRELAEAVGQAEAHLAAAVERAESAEAEASTLRTAVAELELEVTVAEADDEVYELIADVKRGLMTVEELIERTVGK